MFFHEENLLDLRVLVRIFTERRAQSGQGEGSNKKFNTGEKLGQKDGVEHEEASCKFLQERSYSVIVK